MEWQDIHSAPFDQPVLVFRGKEQFVAKRPAATAHYKRPGFIAAGGVWIHPTHWAALPEPPK